MTRLTLALVTIAALAAGPAVPAFGQDFPGSIIAQKGQQRPSPARPAEASKGDTSRNGSGQPSGNGQSAQQPAQATDGQLPPSAGVLALLPPDSVTEKTLRTRDGKEIAYTATAGTLNMFGQNGERSAAIFYTAYVAKNAGPDRPVTFAFNGGPGAGSAFLNLGIVGPKVLDFGPNANDGAVAQLTDNPDSWVAFTDLVMIDPVGTGWSRTVKPDDAKNFYGVQSDAESIAKAIALYVAKNSRTESPKYLLGESYGGFRAAKVAGRLIQSQGITVSGIVMLSPFIDGGLTFGSRPVLGPALQLPPLAASELERRNAFSVDALKAAEQFAMTDYLTTLAGPYPSGPAAEAFYNRVVQFTGMPLDIVRTTRGVIGDTYVKHSRESDSAIVSRYDATLVAPDPHPESPNARASDPVLEGFIRSYGGAFVGYARDQLGFKTDMTYNLLANDVTGAWNWQSSRFQASASDDIRQQLALTPSFRLLIAHGYSDMITTYTASKYIVDHMPPELTQGRVALKTYPGGHMFYTRPSSRSAFTADAKAFYTAQASGAKD